MKPIQAAFHPLSENRLSIFIFHRVLHSPDPIFPEEPDADQFQKTMVWIKSWFSVLPLDVAVNAMKIGKLPPRAAAITFDDGYADNHDVALPILRKHGLTATFFIATGFIDGGRMWNDTVIESIRNCTQELLDLQPLELGCHDISDARSKHKAIGEIINKIKYRSPMERLEKSKQISKISEATLRSDLMMTSKHVRALQNAGMQIGAHTVSHPILSHIDFNTAHDEIASSKEVLESLICEPIRIFAYPNGKPNIDYLPAHTAIVRDLGFSAAVSTEWGTADKSTDVFQLPRFTPWSKSKVKFAAQLARNLLRHT